MGLLDDQPYVPTSSDAQDLIAVLAAHFWQMNQVKRISRSLVVGARIDWQQPMEDVWPEVIENAAGRGNLRKLVERAARDVSAEPLFQRLLSEHPAPGLRAPVGFDMRQTPRLWTTHAMIDRVALRRKVKSMQGVDGQRALLVVGRKDSGTSHARRYMTYLRDKGLLPQVLTIDNEFWAGAPITVQELAQQIALVVVGDQAPKIDLLAQPQSVATQFRLWFSDVATNLNGPVWLVFDNFTADSATEGALKLITDIATAAADNQLGAMRVTVCGYEGAVPPYPGAALETMEHFTGEDVKEFFKQMSVLLTGEESKDEAIELLFSRFVEDGAVEDRPITELGPSALALARSVYEEIPR